MKKIIVFVLCFLFVGCIGSDSYYRAQESFYTAQSAAISAQKPLTRVTTPDGTVVEVANPNQTAVIQQIKNPIVETIKTIVSSTPVSILAGGWAAREVLKASTGDVTNTDNSSAADDHSAVSEPTIVPAADPVIVEHTTPVIVKPEIVKPEIVIVPNGGINEY